MLESGIHRDLPMQDYLDDEAIGSSSLCKISSTPADYKAALTAPHKDSKPLIFGTMAHSKMLEPDTFYDYYIDEIDFGNCRKKENKEKKDEWLKLHDGKIIVSASDKAALEKIEKAANQHDELCEILMNGVMNVEITGIAEFAKHLTPGGLRLKTREDIISDGWIYDIKTTSSPVTDIGIARTIMKYQYHLKAAHHTQVMRRAGLDIKGFGWIFVTTNQDACHIVVKKLSEALLQASIDKHMELLSLLARCTKTDSWPGYSQKVEEIKELKGLNC